MTQQEIFYKKADHLVHRVLELSPTAATQMGDHRFDGRLGDFTPEGLDGQNGEIKAALADFRAMDPRGFSLDAQIGLTLVVHILSTASPSSMTPPMSTREESHTAMARPMPIRWRRKVVSKNGRGSPQPCDVYSCGFSCRRGSLTCSDSDIAPNN